jgi:membrane-associated protein
MSNRRSRLVVPILVGRRWSTEQDRMMIMQFLQRLGEQIGAWTYLIAGFLTFAEAALMIGIVFPGETALLVAGLAAHQGYIGLWPMITVAVLAAVLGDSVGYEVGRRLGPRLRRSRLGARIGPQRWATAEDFLDHHGGKAVLLGRFTALLRALTPGVAGMTRLPYLRTFLPWNIAGGVLWGSGCVLLGYTFSASLTTVGSYLTWAPLAVIVVLAAGYVAVHLRRRARAKHG